MKKFLFVLGAGLILPLVVHASIGVGVGTGKIIVDEEMKPGQIYNLPSLMVLNTGTEASNYDVSVEFNEIQDELKPERAWFDFEPKDFRLEPGKAQEVKIILNLPMKDVPPGDYFAYLEAHPSNKVENGQTQVGIAAAAKLYFSVSPASFLTGLYYRAVSLYKIYSPWSYIVPSLLLAGLAIMILRKYISFNIGITVKK